MAGFSSRIRLVGRMVDRTRQPDPVVSRALTELVGHAVSHQELDEVKSLLVRARAKYAPWFDGEVVPLKQAKE